MKQKNTRDLMAEAKFYESYGRVVNGKHESWDDAVFRVMDMHKDYYKDKMTPELEEYINIATEAYLNKEVLGAQRALQFGGEQLLKNHMKMYNCFHKDTSFITSEGVKTFSEYHDGDEVLVPTHNGTWQKAIVKSYGEQQLNRVTFRKGTNLTNVLVTKDHRWLLHNGKESTMLSIGDRLLKPKNFFKEFEYDNAEPMERLYWCYGMVYGDGTRIQNKDGENKYSLIRLCGADKQFQKRFKEVGFKTSTNSSLKGDFFAYTGSYLKTTPDPVKDNPKLIRAFVAGYLQADGEKNGNYSKNSSGSKYIGIQSSELDHIDFIRKCFPIAGVWIISETDLTGQVTNYGTRPHTIRFRITDSLDTLTTAGWSVKSIEENIMTDTVWCLEVDKDKSFIMPNGIVTGNCSASYCDRANFFGELMHTMLCGAGVGFSVQWHHIASLPSIAKRTRQAKTFVVPDSIEGWAEAVDVLMHSFFDIESKYKGNKIYFDLSKIRPKGALISGGFKAPGPEPLRKALDKVEQLLSKVIEDERSRLKPIEAYDICMFLADAVISGGVRRSAALTMFSKDDHEMMTAKTGDWWTTNPQRGRSNNSVVLIRNELTKEEFIDIMKSVKDYGEPGFLFMDNKDFLFNPCFHKDTRIHTTTGLRRIEDLYYSQEENQVVIDTRAGAGDKLELENYGTTIKPATAVKLTQKNADIYEVKLSNGASVKATLNHEFPTTKGRFQLKDLKVGDTLLVQSEEGQWGSIGNYNQGLILGLITGDGTFTKSEALIDIWENDFNVEDMISSIVAEEIKSVVPIAKRKYKDVDWNIQEKGKKKRIGGHKLYRLLKENLNIENPQSIKQYVPECIWQGSREMVVGYLQGFFFADGSVQLVGKGTKSTLSFRLNQSNKEILQEVQILLQNFGISSRIYSRRKAAFRELPDGKGGIKEYWCKENFELIINRTNLIKFLEKIDIFGFKKQVALDYLEKRGYSCRKKEKYLVDITEINFFSTEDVYCLNQEETHTVLANAVVCGNCVEINMYGYAPDGSSGFQTCVRGDTKIITRDGLEEIKNCVELEKEIEIWNGRSWRQIVPFKTGDADEFWRVHLSDGSYLDATANHKFLINENLTLTTLELIEYIKENQAVIPFSNIVYEDGQDNEDAYQLGLNGIYTKSIFALSPNGINKYLEGLYEHVSGEDVNSDILAFKDSQTFFGLEKDMREFQLLLTKIGKKSIINEIGSNSANKYNFCVKIDEDIKQEIISIEKLNIIEPSYCLYEEERNMCVFNNILTFQCNLTEINGGKAESEEMFFKQCEAASILGTLQAGYTDFQYVSKATKEIVENESLIGVSITGWMNNPQILFDDAVMEKGAQIVKDTNKKVAKLIGIKQAARTTTVKPSGNASVLLGTASGIHGEHSPLYFRHVQFNKETEVAKLFKEQNPEMVEESVWSSGKTDYCVAFPVISPPNSVYKRDLMGIKQLEYVKKAQNNWVKNGTNVELCVHPKLQHNVSNTITIDDWDKVTDYLYENRNSFCGVSFLAASGDKAYAQAPFTEVFTLKQIIKKYGDEALFTSALIEAALGAFDGDLWSACSTALGYGEDISEVNHHNVLKRDFVRRFEKFAKHFSSKEECSNCLKDVYNFHKWWRIQNSLSEMDFTFTEEKKIKDIDTMGAQACSGGACEIW